MRILILTSVYPPLGYSGHDERCRQTVKGLASRGHLLQILTSDHRLPPMGVNGEKGVFRELSLHTEDQDSVLGKSYKVTYAHEHYNAECLDYRISRFRPDVVYVWNMRNLSKSLLFRLERKQVRVVYDIHDTWLAPERFGRDPWFRWWHDNSSKRSKIYRGYASVVGRARRILNLLPVAQSTELDLSNSYICSEWLKQQLIDSGVPAVSDLPVVHPSIDIRGLKPKNKYTSGGRFVWAGRLNENKAPRLAVDAIKLLRDDGISVSLDVYGMGEPSERKALRDYIDSLGLIEHIQMQGIRPGELSEHYAKYDAFLYTCRDGEPFSMTVLEAMQSRLPCIVPKIGGNIELLREGEAILVEPNSAQALAQAVKVFMSLDDHGLGLSNAWIERLQAEQSSNVFCQKIEAFLEGI